MRLLDKREINFAPLLSIGQTIILIFVFFNQHS